MLLRKDCLGRGSAPSDAFQLEDMRNSLFKEVRGMGLLIAVELMQNGILAKETHETTIRFAPPLVIRKREIDTAIAIIRRTLKPISDTI